jgi:hypothetical protein
VASKDNIRLSLDDVPWGVGGVFPVSVGKAGVGEREAGSTERDAILNHENQLNLEAK